MTHYRNIDELPPALRAQAQAQLGCTPAVATAPAPRAKYGNRRVTCDGKTFDSQLEADYYRHLCLLWHAGEVCWLVRQVEFDLPGGIVYRADFLVVYRLNDDRMRIEVEDTKGVLTPDCRNKLKLMQAPPHGITVQIVERASARTWRVRPWR